MQQSAAATKKRTKVFMPRSAAGFDLPFFLIVIVLITIGLVMMFSASYAWGLYEKQDSFLYIRKQLLFAGVGLVGMLVVSWVDYHFLRMKVWVYGIFGVSLVMLVYVGLLSRIKDKTIRWIEVGGLFQFQPSEIMKFAIILLFAHMIARNYKKMHTIQYGIVPYIGILGIVAGLMMLQPHLSGTILILLIGVVMMFVGGTKIKHLGVIAAIGVGVLILGVFVLMELTGVNYFEERIQSFLHPESDVQGSTFQTWQSLITIGSGGLFGLGLGQSRQKFLYLPESQNDFVFSIVCEELGFIGAMVVILLFVMLIFRGFYIASKASDKFGALLVVGITVQIGLQALLNIAVVTNSVPNTGISLPFFSYGGTALMMQLFEMGVVLNVSRHAALE